MKSKKDLVNIINNYKMINSDIENLPNGEKYIWAKFSSNRTREDRMTINDLAKEMREGFKLVNNRIDEVNNRIDEFKQEVNTRFDKIEKRLDEHDAIFKRNNLK